MKNLTWQVPEQQKVAQELINKVKSKCCGIKVNFKERLCNVKLKDIDAFAKKHMSINWVTERTKQLKNVG